MIDWVTVSSLATAGGTLVLAVATFASVRSSNKSARVAERAFMIGLRPLLVPSRPQDPDQPVGFADEFKVHLVGGGATADVTDGAIYLTMSLRNAGNGLAVLRGWHVTTAFEPRADHVRVGEFTQLTRDLYVAPADIGFWQGALRDPAAPLFAEVRAAISSRQRLMVELLYGDYEGGQRTISRFTLQAHSETWTSAIARHWHLDTPNPR